MKKANILHPQLARIVASLGHGDMIVVCDAGLPIPPGVERVDLAFSLGKPSILDVLEIILSEMCVESAKLATEIRESKQSRSVHAELQAALAQSTSIVEYTTHQELKDSLIRARAIIRTGEATPYANVCLFSGVVF